MAILLSDSYKVINWDLNTKSLDTKYWGKVTDSGRGCKVALLQNGVLKIPSTETMRVNFKKPSGLQIFLDGVISGNYFVFDFTEQVFAEQGEVMAELMLNVGGEWLMSSTFYIQVDQSFTSAIESSEEFTALQTALSDVDELKNDIIALENPVYTEASALANLVSGELLTVALGKIKKAISTFTARTDKTDFSADVTMGTMFTSLRKKAVVKNNRVVLQMIALGNTTIGANALHNFGTLPIGKRPLVQVDTVGCVQDGNYLYNGSVVVQITSAGAINVSSNIAMTSKYVQFSVAYDLD